MSLRPTIEEERWLSLAARYRDYANYAPVAHGCGQWHRTGLIARISLFVLGAIIAVGTIGMSILGGLPAAALWGGALLIVAAEFLIRRNHFHASGIEESLWLCGAAVIGFWLSEKVSLGNSSLEMPAIAIACFGLAGWRLGNAFFIAVAALAVGWLLDKQVGGPPFWYLGAASVALGLGGRIYRRPFHDRVLNWLIIVLPVGAYLYATERLTKTLATVILVCLLVYGVLALAAAWRRRSHAPLIAGLLSLGCCAHHLLSLGALSLHVQLLLAGFLLLAVSWWADRFLRRPFHGIESTPIEAHDDDLDIAAAAGAAVATPSASVAKAPEIAGGGSFGGGGAGGRY